MNRTPLKRKAAKPKRRVTGCQTRGCKRRGPFVEAGGGRWCIKHADEEAWRRFSWFIRTRDGRCTHDVLTEITCRGVLQAAHIVGRKAKATKYDPQNVHALCEAHHLSVDSVAGHEARKWAWAVSRLGLDDYEALMSRGRSFADRRSVVIDALEAYPPKPTEEVA